MDQCRNHLSQTIQNPTLTQRSMLQSKNKSIDQENDHIKSNNLKKIADFKKIISQNVTSYKPADKDLTDIDAAFDQINTVINESIYQSYDNIIVAILSDGINQPHSSKVETINKRLNCSRKFSLYTIGWLDQSIFNNISNREKLASKDDLIRTLENLTCK